MVQIPSHHFSDSIDPYIHLKYIHTEKVVSSYNEVHTYSIVITLHACRLWNMPPYRPSVGSYSCISGCEYFEV